MPASTKAWMPMYIGDLLGDTLHLSAAEFGAYHFIMYHQWRRGPIPAQQLRAITRLSKDQWEESESTLKAFLTLDEDGMYYQRRCLQEKVDAEEVFSSKVANGKLGGLAKARKLKPSENVAESKRNTSEQSSEQSSEIVANPTPSQSQSHIQEEQVPSRDKREVDARHVSFKAAVMAYAAFKGVKLAWDGSEAKALSLLLKSLPEMTLQEFQSCLNNRARSPGTPHGERPRVWLPHIARYQQGPLNEFGRTGEANGNAAFKGKTESSLDAAQQAIAIILRREANGDYDRFSEAWGTTPSETGAGRLLGAG